jgi:hypothetical protein
MERAGARIQQQYGRLFMMTQIKTLSLILFLSTVTFAQIAQTPRTDHREKAECNDAGKAHHFPGVLLDPSADQTITGAYSLILRSGAESLLLSPGFQENHTEFAQGIDLYTHNDPGFRAPYINFYKSGRTQLYPSPLTFTGYELDSMGGLNFGGYDGSSYAVGAAIYTNNDEDWSPNGHGGHVNIYATFNGQTTQHQIAQFNGKDPQGNYADNIIFYEPLVFYGNQAGYPGLFPSAHPAGLSVRTGDNSIGATLTVGSLVVANPNVPTTAFDQCTTGTIAWDANFVYVCVAPNTWRRSALTAW